MARIHRVETRLNDRELGLLKEFAESLDIPMSEALRTLVQSLKIHLIAPAFLRNANANAVSERLLFV